jgi:hypothetical protein
VVVALEDVLPDGKRVARDVWLARFDAAPVFGRIGADDLDVERGHAGAFRHGAPRCARERPWIDAVGDDRPARAEVVFCHGVGDVVSLAIDAIACLRSACSIESIRRYTAPIVRANSRAMTVLPTPGKPLKMTSIAEECIRRAGYRRRAA